MRGITIATIAAGALVAASCGSEDEAATGPATEAPSVPLVDASGAAFVIHATADDYSTDPSGDSGDRIACAVLTG